MKIISSNTKIEIWGTGSRYLRVSLGRKLTMSSRTPGVISCTRLPTDLLRLKVRLPLQTWAPQRPSLEPIATTRLFNRWQTSFLNLEKARANKWKILRNFRLKRRKLKYKTCSSSNKIRCSKSNSCSFRRDKWEIIKWQEYMVGQRWTTTRARKWSQTMWT